jgi:site-specific DNA recombinase
VHTIFSGLAAFYSDNLATEVIKGTKQKVLAGGTPMMAPIGYLNAPVVIDGVKSRTVILDDDRAPLIRWAFEACATGDWSLNRLAAELTLRGLTKRPTRKRLAEPLNAKQPMLVLRNPYYMGIVTWQGIQHDGTHPELVTPEAFQRVQEVLTAHRQSGERSYRRKHYLAGTVYCDLCGSKLIYMLSRGRAGDQYGYWACLGRHTYKTGCPLPYLPDEAIEDLVVRQWSFERLSTAQAETLRDNLLLDLAGHTAAIKEAAERLDQRIEAIQRERRKWAEKAMAETVPDDIAREKQADLGQQLAAAQQQRAKLQLTSATHEVVIRHATELLILCDTAYAKAPEALRRDFNQAWFTHLKFNMENGHPTLTTVQRSDWAEALHTATEEPAVEAESALTEALASVEIGQKERPDRPRYRVTSLSMVLTLQLWWALLTVIRTTYLPPRVGRSSCDL